MFKIVLLICFYFQIGFANFQCKTLFFATKPPNTVIFDAQKISQKMLEDLEIFLPQAYEFTHSSNNDTKKLQKMVQRLEETLNLEQINNYRSYKQLFAGNHSTINEYLREKVPPKVTIEEFFSRKKDTHPYKNQLMLFSSLFAKANFFVPKNSILFRGVALSSKELHVPRVGKVFETSEFLSTSLDPDTVKMFSVYKERPSTIFIIELKEDTPFIPGNISEAEIILQRGLKFKVIKNVTRKMDAYGNKYVVNFIHLQSQP